uniref:Uncharacterized protein n=1 Tax=Solanum lycopersicum TaxID=4081 RepID=A0A3Q7EUU7_SOLLC
MKEEGRGRELRREDNDGFESITSVCMCGNVEKVKRQEEDEYASGGNNSPKRLSSRTDDSEVVDHVYYFEDGENASNKGISLSMHLWNVLRDHADEIDKVVSENNLMVDL